LAKLAACVNAGKARQVLNKVANNAEKTDLNLNPETIFVSFYAESGLTIYVRPAHFFNYKEK
jgi:ribosomal protein L22